ncbi:MAG: ribonucleotide reductase N-terminal alpha domain-containing protein, partial [Phycisphaerae bacterium]
MSGTFTDRVTGVMDDATQQEVQLCENGLRVLEARYLKRDGRGRLTETPAELFRRVACAVAEAERLYGDDPGVRSDWEDRFNALMTSARFMPNSPTLMNAGREMGMLS